MREQGLKGSYGFRFQEHPYPFQVNLWNIGWEVVRSPTYSWNGQTRIDREKKLCFNTRYPDMAP